MWRFVINSKHLGTTKNGRITLAVYHRRCAIQTLTFKTRTGKDGLVRLEIPTDIPDHDIEIVLVMQAVVEEPVDEMGYPVGYFEETYGMFADNPIERNQPPYPDTRDEIEK